MFNDDFNKICGFDIECRYLSESLECDVENAIIGDNSSGVPHALHIVHLLYLRGLEVKDNERGPGTDLSGNRIDAIHSTITRSRTYKHKSDIVIVMEAYGLGMISHVDPMNLNPIQIDDRDALLIFISNP